MSKGCRCAGDCKCVVEPDEHPAAVRDRARRGEILRWWKALVDSCSENGTVHEDIARDDARAIAERHHLEIPDEAMEVAMDHVRDWEETRREYARGEDFECPECGCQQVEVIPVSMTSIKCTRCHLMGNAKLFRPEQEDPSKQV